MGRVRAGFESVVVTGTVAPVGKYTPPNPSSHLPAVVEEPWPVMANGFPESFRGFFDRSGERDLPITRGK